MTWQQKLKHELKAVGQTSLFFGAWIAGLALLKQLLLAEYQIAFHGLSLALVGALILAKVVLVLERVPLGNWVRRQPAWGEVLLRTLLYSAGVLVVLLIEKAFEGRHEHGGFVSSLTAVFHHAEIHHVWVNTICLSGALFVYLVLTVIRRHLGAGGLLRLFLMPPPPVAQVDGATGPTRRAVGKRNAPESEKNP